MADVTIDISGEDEHGKVVAINTDRFEWNVELPGGVVLTMTFDQLVLLHAALHEWVGE